MTAVCVCGASFDRILNQSVGSLREYDSVEDNKNFKWDKDWAVRRTILLQSPTATSTASAYKWLEQASRIWRWNGLTSHGDLKHAPLLKKKTNQCLSPRKERKLEHVSEEVVPESGHYLTMDDEPWNVLVPVLGFGAWALPWYLDKVGLNWRDLVRPNFQILEFQSW